MCSAPLAKPPQQLMNDPHSFCHSSDGWNPSFNVEQYLKFGWIPACAGMTEEPFAGMTSPSSTCRGLATASMDPADKPRDVALRNKPRDVGPQHIPNSIAIFGGSFDPIHLGHIKTALAVQKAFQFDKFFFVPCKQPLLKNLSTTTPQQRLEMLAMALQPYPEFKLDAREIERNTPSYTVETLLDLRQEYPDNPITLILGMDSFLQLYEWYQWEKIFCLSSILVLQRPNIKKKLPSYSGRGEIIFFNAGNYEISSSWIRANIQNLPAVEKLLPKEVLEYIIRHKLYI